MMRDTSTQQPILRVRDLSVSAGSCCAPKPLVRGISFDIERGGVIAMVGESGSGKTLTALAILGLLPGEDLHIERGCIQFDGRDLTRESEQSLRAIRGRRISMVFQNAASSLNPCLPAREHIVEPLQLHAGLATDAARAEASRLMREVGIRDAGGPGSALPPPVLWGRAAEVVDRSSSRLRPELLIADEPDQRARCDHATAGH